MDLKKAVPYHDTLVADVTVNDKLRQLLHNATIAAGVSILRLVSAGAWAVGSDTPKKTEVKIGFIQLTDCASIVMASLLGFDKKYGIKIVLSK